jgi:ABC-type glycerol-3-phosphate transport system substrate-binding protein
MSDVRRPGRLDRRSLLKAMGAAGAALAVNPALSACVSGGGSASSSSSEGIPAGSASAQLTMHHDAGVGPLFQPYVEDFNKRYKPLSLDTNYVTSDYAGATNTQLAGGSVDYDALFTDGGYAQSWFDNGWIRSLDEFDGVSELKSSWSAGVLAENTAADGKLITLPYYRRIELFLYNQAHLGKIGAQPPTSWAEFVEQCRELKSKGVVATPYSPFWTAEFSMFWIELVTEAFSDGSGPLFDEDFQPVFADDPVVRSTLERWKLMLAEKLVPQDVFTTAYGDIANIYAGGRSAFTVRYGPQAKGFRDKKVSQVAASSRNGLMPGKTRETMAGGAQWCMTASSKNQPQAWTLLNYLSAKDKDGKYYVPKQLIALDLGLLTPYDEVNNDPDVVKAWSAWADTEVINQQLGKSRSLGAVTNQSWYGEFQTKATSILQDAVRGKNDIGAALGDVADYVRSKI